jgi:hypothetical protein
MQDLETRGCVVSVLERVAHALEQVDVPGSEVTAHRVDARTWQQDGEVLAGDDAADAAGSLAAVLQQVPGEDRGADGGRVGDVGRAGIRRVQQPAVTQVAEPDGLDQRLALVAHRFAGAYLGGGAEVGPADGAVAQVLLDAPRFLHARQHGAYDLFDGQTRALGDAVAREQVELVQGLDEFDLGTAGVDPDVGDLGEGAVERQQLLLVQRVLAHGLELVRKIVDPRAVERVQPLHAAEAKLIGLLRELLQRDRRRPGEDHRVGVDVFEQVEIDALDPEVLAPGRPEMVDVFADQEVGDPGRDAEVDHRGNAAFAQRVGVAVLREGEGAPGLLLVHVRSEIERMCADADRQFEDRRIEDRRRRIDQQHRAGHLVQEGRVSGEDRCEVRYLDEFDALEQVLGVEQGILRTRRVDAENDEAHRDPVALGDLVEADQHARAHSAETEEDDRGRIGGSASGVLRGHCLVPPRSAVVHDQEVRRSILRARRPAGGWPFPESTGKGDRW